ncbi:uncharacterized protein PGTG_10581 [Puccinia graminis f. sp. tritici CRL 75-36-700-3]|uniref:Uncharacterized protein n=1 Tax=Puccinia graminis f. sp. tritici (strain CRL 75-36-700-3 / race SCCL) TaxID=418459 RepID=E3KIS8_PUCGT|nr:uncharacterized protein PGTG_10581 [Puccinia graminis f. sp. tritici CRL 75-36-700-3]EFP84203.2 hypothetical protein PGTG_10581 [Puccinia graminis f. sp. tritici CRL 75-36-700-3]
MQLLQILLIICGITTFKASAGPTRMPQVKEPHSGPAGVSTRNPFEVLGQISDDSDHDGAHGGNLASKMDGHIPSNQEDVMDHKHMKPNDVAAAHQPIKSNTRKNSAGPRSSIGSSSVATISKEESDAEAWARLGISCLLGLKAMGFIAKTAILNTPHVADYFFSNPVQAYKNMDSDYWSMMGFFLAFKVLFDPHSFIQLKLPGGRKTKIELLKLYIMALTFPYRGFIFNPISHVFKSTSKVLGF